MHADSLCECLVVRMTPRSRCGVLLSGGIDSALVVTLLTLSGWSVEALWVAYGQPAEKAERRASRALAQHFEVPWREAIVRGVVVPREGEIVGRNDLLVSAARACLPGSAIAIGVHSGTPYADCSEEWVGTWQALLDVQHSGTVSLLAPLAALDKPEIMALADTHAVPIDLTHSCERGNEPCQSCRSCLDRRAAVART